MHLLCTVPEQLVCVSSFLLAIALAMICNEYHYVMNIVMFVIACESRCRVIAKM